MRATGPAPIGRARFVAGVGLFGLGFAAPLLIPVVTGSDLTASSKATISGLLALGVPEVMMLVAASVMGKAGFAELKRRLAAFLRRLGPPREVSRARYRIGLVMFAAPLLWGWLGPYLGPYLPRSAAPWWGWPLAGDVVFLASFFVLGGGFWDKLRALFRYDAYVTPSEAPLRSIDVG